MFNMGSNLILKKPFKYWDIVKIRWQVYIFQNSDFSLESLNFIIGSKYH